MASHPEAKAYKAKTLKPRKDKAAMLEKRKAKRAAKAEKRAEKATKAKVNAEAKKVVGGNPRKEKYSAKKKVVSDEKRKAKLKTRVEKLQKKADALFKEAKKAAAQYQALLDAEKNATESRSEQDSDNDDDDSSSESGTSSSDASEASDASENKGGVLVNQEPTEVPEDIPADEIVMKHRRLSNAGSERSRISVADVPSEVEEPKNFKNKKEKKVRVVEPEEVKEEANKSKPEHDEPEISDKKAKKAEKKRKREAEAKAKAEKGSEESAAQTEQWQVDGLEGGSARQAKFLRLLGGKKAGAAAPAAHSSATKGTSDSTKAEADIQKQFEAGMKMKNEAGSKRRGLGA
ncbi:hypothetical protein FPOA_10391 [Fusarium poae]|uniref:Small acidic protein n=1 Tax=Fusarium poae TaxID=36050 RepID=A0A1B8ADX7_FUSPO|nr:hypothetical protein FPOA_10391 [Fusarium poae]